MCAVIACLATTAILQNFRSFPEGTESVELLDKNAMWPVRFLYKIGTCSQSMGHKRLFVGVVLDLVANQDPVLGRSRIYVIHLSSVSDGGNLARRQRAHSLLLFGRGHSFWLEPSSLQQVFLLRFRAGTDGSALASPYQSHQ
jgi:hypothetical protein